MADLVSKGYHSTFWNPNSCKRGLHSFLALVASLPIRMIKLWLYASPETPQSVLLSALGHPWYIIHNQKHFPYGRFHAVAWTEGRQPVVFSLFRETVLTLFQPATGPGVVGPITNTSLVVIGQGETLSVNQVCCRQQQRKLLPDTTLVPCYPKGTSLRRRPFNRHACFVLGLSGECISFESVFCGMDLFARKCIGRSKGYLSLVSN